MSLWRALTPRASSGRTLGRALLLCIVVLSATFSAAKEKCQSLATSDRDLYVVDAGGRAHRLTFDREEKGEASLSDDGQLVAYTRQSQPRKVIVIDAGGRTMTEATPAQPIVTYVAHLGWVGHRLLWYEGHTGPNSGVFEMWKLERHADLSSRKTVLLSFGSGCALPPAADRVACITDLPPGPDSRSSVIVAQRNDAVDWGEVPDDALGRAVYTAPKGFLIDGTPAWDQAGQHLAFVETTEDESSRMLVTLTRSATDSEWKFTRTPVEGLARGHVDVRSMDRVGTVQIAVDSVRYELRPASRRARALTSDVTSTVAAMVDGRTVTMTVLERKCLPD